MSKDIHPDRAPHAPVRPTTTTRNVAANGSVTGGSFHPALTNAPQDQASFNRAAIQIVERITGRKG